MLKDITGIRLEGANFASATDLQLFVDENLQGSNNARISLLYGKNGSGKTTISKAFRKISNAHEPALRIAVPIDASGQEVPLSEEECHHIHVFNENFIQNQVSLQSEGLETVVVLGAAIDVQKQLEEALERFNALAEQRKTQKQIVSHLSDSTSKDSPKYCLYQIGNSLRGADGWAERDRLIRGTRQATRVFDNTYEQFLPLTPSKSREQLLEEFEDGLRRLEQAKSGELKILAIVPHSFQIPFDEESVLELLSKKLEEPILSDREKRLIELAKEHGTGYVQRIGKFASETSNRTCPFCLQAVSDDYKSRLYSSVEMVLNEDIKDHQRRLQEKRLSPLSVDFSPFSALDPQLLKDCNEALNALNGTIEQINNCVDQKILNVFSPIIVEPFCLAEKLQAFITAMSQLEELRLQHNRSVTDPKPIRTELESINADIASYDIKAPYARYIAQLEEYNSAKTAYESIDTEYQEVLAVIRQLQEKKKSVVIAKDLMHLFNLNEQSIFHYLSKDFTKKEVPLCFALDYSQAIGDLGDVSHDYIASGKFGNVTEHCLGTLFRNSPQIADFCASIAASGTVMFSNSFRNPYDHIQTQFTQSDEKKMVAPVLHLYPNDDAMLVGLGEQLNSVMRKLQCKQKEIAVVCFDSRWLSDEGLQIIGSKSGLSFQRLNREDRIQSNQYIITSPYDVNGLEFKAVIMLGVDEGRVPQTSGTSDISRHFILYSAYNMLYLVASRAKYCLVAMGSELNGISSCLEHSIKAETITVEKH